MRVRVMISAALACGAVSGVFGERIAPCPGKDSWWMPRHEEKLREIRDSNGEFDIVFFGDSISHNWEGWKCDPDSPGRKLLAEIRRRYSVFIPGFGGDRTYHALWRARNGELDGYRARVITLLIGTNNWKENTPEETVADIRELVGVIREKQPQAKLLLMPILPREQKFKDDLNRRINELISDIPDGKNVFQLDLRNAFAGVPKSLMPDGLHPSRDGYLIWWQAIRPFLGEKPLALEYEKPEGEPFEMPPIARAVFPDRDFIISDYGAKADGSKCTGAINAAIEACSKAGGGRVVVPAGRWFTGGIRFRSGVELHLGEDAVLEFSDDKADYLPVVRTTWEGVECLNTSPLIYAYECENVAITGKGTLTARDEGWYARAEPAKGTPEHEERRPVMKAAWLTNYMWGATNAALEARNLLTACPKAELRPQFIQFNRCRNVRLEGFRLRRSPFWCVHLYLSENVIARGLDLKANRHNNDAFDVDMTRNVLIEDCTLDNSDDGFCMKAGRNQDAWRLGTPTENVVVRNCHVRFAHTLLGIGSELSGGIRNISLHDCTADETYLMFFIKTNRRRGGFVKDIYLKDVTAPRCFTLASVDTEVFYQYADFPEFEVRPTEIAGLHIEGVRCEETLRGVSIRGDERRPIKGVALKDISVGRILPKMSIGTWEWDLDEGEKRVRVPIEITSAEDISIERVTF